MTADDPIETYLDDVLVRLPGSPREVRHALAEIDAHLHALAAEEMASGMGEAEARAEAVRRIGPVAGVLDAPRLLPRMTVELRRRFALATLLLGAVGGIAIGVGGFFAWLARLVWGDNAIALSLPQGLTAPGLAANQAFEFVRNTTMAGVLGLLAAVAYRLLRRRWAMPMRQLPGIEYVIGAVLAAVCAIGLALFGVDALVVAGRHGSGAPFSLAVAAALAACWFVLVGRRVVRRSCVG